MYDRALLDELMQMHFEYAPAICAAARQLFMRGEGYLLALLYAEGRPIYSGELKRLTGLTTGRIANILKQLEGKSYITRTPQGSDRRRIAVALTDSGRERIEAELDEMKRSHARLLEYLGEKDSEEFIRLIKKALSFWEAD